MKCTSAIIIFFIIGWLHACPYKVLSLRWHKRALVPIKKPKWIFIDYKRMKFSLACFVQGEKICSPATTWYSFNDRPERHGAIVIWQLTFTKNGGQSTKPGLKRRIDLIPYDKRNSVTCVTCGIQIAMSYFLNR